MSFSKINLNNKVMTFCSIYKYTKYYTFYSALTLQSEIFLVIYYLQSEDTTYLLWIPVSFY